jgi:molecular chaperone GrpE
LNRDTTKPFDTGDPMFWRKRKMSTTEEIKNPHDIEIIDLNADATASVNDQSDHDLDSDGGEDDGLDGMGAGMPDFEQVQALMSKLQRADELEGELSEVKLKYARLLQDFEQYRRRMSDEQQEAKTKGESAAIEAVLPVYDDLSRALDFGVANPEKLIPGLQSVRDNFLKTLTGYGAEAVAGKGELFDPNVHEAIGVVPGEDEEERVAEVYQMGFMLRGRLVRPARVVVARKPSDN